MALSAYRDSPLNTGTLIDPVDVFSGDGSTTTFNLTNKTGNRLAATITFDNLQYYQYNGGFTKSGNSFTLSSAPPADSQGVAPGQSTLLFDAMFDVDTVEGVSDPRVREAEFILADPEQAHLYKYEANPNYPGIQVAFVDLVTSYGAETSWVQLACATPDAAGTAMTYSATGAPIYMAGLTGFGLLIASAVAGASSCLVDLASTFYAGDYIIINSGQVTQEVVKIHGISGQTMTISGFDYDHYIDEPVYTAGRKFWAKCTVPVNAASNIATNFYDLALQVLGVRISRV